MSRGTDEEAATRTPYAHLCNMPPPPRPGSNLAINPGPLTKNPGRGQRSHQAHLSLTTLRRDCPPQPHAEQPTQAPPRPAERPRLSLPPSSPCSRERGLLCLTCQAGKEPRWDLRGPGMGRCTVSTITPPCPSVPTASLCRSAPAFPLPLSLPTVQAQGDLLMVERGEGALQVEGSRFPFYTHGEVSCFCRSAAAFAAAVCTGRPCR